MSQSVATREGAGVRLRRAFPLGDPGEFDPFLLLDDFRSDDPNDYRAGFPWHPHRGIETITYVLAGAVEHQDSLGNKGLLGSGDIQWMTAGSGILHQEMPQGDPRGRMHGFQLWANLPSSLKMTKPRYQDILARDVPEVVEDDGTRFASCAGLWRETGPVEGIAADPRYLDVSVPAGRRKRLAVDVAQHAFAYVFAGSGSFRDASDPARGADRAVGSRPRRQAVRRRVQPVARALRPRRRSRGSCRGAGHPVPARLGKADRGADRLVRADRDEHGGGTPPGAAGTQNGTFIK